jgi:hypothetical protein
MIAKATFAILYKTTRLMEQELSCPVSPDRVNETVVRTVAVLVLACTCCVLYFQLPMGALLLAIDFTVRAFTNGRLSPLRQVALLIAQTLQLPAKPIDAAPKKFAAGVGIVFSTIIALFLLLNWIMAAYTAGAILLVCAFLEGAFGICVGCIVYSYIVLPVLKGYTAAKNG